MGNFPPNLLVAHKETSQRTLSEGEWKGDMGIGAGPQQGLVSAPLEGVRGRACTFRQGDTCLLGFSLSSSHIGFVKV